MKHVRVIIAVLCCTAFAVLGVMSAQDEEAPATEDGFERVASALPYLSSHVPEHRLQAEQIVEAGADEHFERLLEKLPDQPRAGRETLLRILANTKHEGRVKLCLDTLCNHEARRSERIIASRALKHADPAKLLELIEERLADAQLDPYRRVQCCALLGTIPSARAQGVAESVLEAADEGSLLAFFAEDAVVRSTIATPFAQPAWGRYQTRHDDAPQLALKEFQDLLEDLAQPRAADRAMAEAELQEVIGDDVRVMLALARSPWPERASFALKRLEENQVREFGLATQAVMLDLVTTGEQTVALMAMDVAIAGAPPSDTEMEELRPLVSADSASRLEAILEGMSRGTNLAELRENNQRLKAKLRPLLLRRSAFDEEVRALLNELAQLRSRLERLEEQWAGGWKREFEVEILGVSRE
jgi:hypothetical protein